jgi:hypothetical protein
METTVQQLIWTDNGYETGNGYESAESAARAGCAEVPAWPIQDAGARWHHEQFPGQLVCYSHGDVHFGFLVDPVPLSDVPLDEDGDYDTDGLFVCPEGSFWRAKK